MSGKIFINYRRGEDLGFVHALLGRLESAFATDQVFIDVDSIEPGLDFVPVLKEQVAQCDILLAVIGKGWSDARDETGIRRLDKSEDWVRIEIASALEQEKRVIPVLLGDARMPRTEELPNELKPLATRNAVRLTHERFKADAASLVSVLQKTLARVQSDREKREAEDRKNWEADELKKREVEERKKRRAGERKKRGAEEKESNRSRAQKLPDENQQAAMADRENSEAASRLGSHQDKLLDAVHQAIMAVHEEDKAAAPLDWLIEQQKHRSSAAKLLDEIQQAVMADREAAAPMGSPQEEKDRIWSNELLDAVHQAIMTVREEREAAAPQGGQIEQERNRPFEQDLLDAVQQALEAEEEPQGSWDDHH